MLVASTRTRHANTSDGKTSKMCKTANAPSECAYLQYESLEEVSS